ncbi:XRE family transcriptional regulator [Ornithinimicrobium sp. F0845]|uniref:helix-turn-helix domain-containing protein n=1 Tax=Ornithinimicrobium sp. F0845 TaxID=2926412 RepID=UPI001FF39FF2|nr:XRE family transcriptional regulator [Ornithinimicrobium sp. F0845]
MPDYGDIVRTRRELLGLSQRALAGRVGVTQPMISAIEAGTRTPTEPVRAAIDATLAIRPSTALHARLGEVRAMVRRHGGLHATLIGSAARGQDTIGSDLDLLVEFESDRDIVDLLALEADLAELLTVPVDIVSAGSTGPVVEDLQRGAVPL